MSETIALTKKGSGDKALVSIEKRAGDFAVHKDILAGPMFDHLWKVSHVPSGAGIAQSDSLEISSVIAHVFAVLPGEWPNYAFLERDATFIGNRLMAGWPKEIRAWVQNVARTIIHDGHSVVRGSAL